MVFLRFSRIGSQLSSSSNTPTSHSVHLYVSGKMESFVQRNEQQDMRPLMCNSHLSVTELV